MPEPRPRAAVYCRISLAALHNTTKTDEQERLCREVCERRGWPVAAVFTDNSRSAWQRNRSRPGWDAMLGGIRDGRFGVIVSYWGDRIVRQPRDLEDLLDLRDQRPGLVFASVAGQYDMDNPDHRMMMRWEVARACNESDTISRRKKQEFAMKAAKGVAPAAGGRYHRGFGYDSSGTETIPAEADALREAADRVMTGDLLAHVAADLSARGMRSTSGEPVTGRLLRSLLTRPRIAGLFPDGTPGSWPAIIAPEQQAMVADVLSLRSAGREWSNARAYLLSGIARCGPCGSGLQRSSTTQGKRTYLQYACRVPGCRKVTRNMETLDAYVTSAVLRRLAQSANPAGVVPESPAALEVAGLLAKKAQVEALVADPSRDLGPLLTRLAAVDARLAALREVQALDAAARLRAEHAGMTRQEWDAVSLALRRALVQASFDVTVLPASRRGPGFVSGDVRMVPR